MRGHLKTASAAGAGLTVGSLLAGSLGSALGMYAGYKILTRGGKRISINGRVIGGQEKKAFPASAYDAGPAPTWAHDIAAPSGASLQPPRRVPRLDVAVQKTAAGAPTRGNFMMASDIPPYRPPRLDQAIQKDAELETSVKEKDSDALPDGVVYLGGGGFRPVNINAKHAYAMPTEKLAEFVEGLLKESGRLDPKFLVKRPPSLAGTAEAPGQALSSFRKLVSGLRNSESDVLVPSKVYTGSKHKERWGGVPIDKWDSHHGNWAPEPTVKTAIPGLTPQSRLEQSSHIGAPRATPPPGPSIAQIAKPAGPGFGSGIAGAGKSGISGGSVGGIGAMKPPPQL